MELKKAKLKRTEAILDEYGQVVEPEIIEHVTFLTWGVDSVYKKDDSGHGSYFPCTLAVVMLYSGQVAMCFPDQLTFDTTDIEQ